MKSILVPTEHSAEHGGGLGHGTVAGAKIRQLHRRLPAAAGGRRHGGDGPRHRPDHGRDQGKRRRHGAPGRGPVPLFMERHDVHAAPTRSRGGAVMVVAARGAERPRLRRQLRPRVRHYRAGAAGRRMAEPVHGHARIRAVRKRTPGADRAAEFAADARHQHPDRLELPHRAGARHGIRHAAAAPRRAHHHLAPSKARP